jgi:hypothetical protein
MIPGKGYIFQAPLSFSATTPSIFEAFFSGIPNNGIIPIQVERGSIYGSAFFGTNGSEINNLSDNWNLLGNPYPSAIDAMEFISLTIGGNDIDAMEYIPLIIGGNDMMEWGLFIPSEL